MHWIKSRSTIASGRWFFFLFVKACTISFRKTTYSSDTHVGCVCVDLRPIFFHFMWLAYNVIHFRISALLPIYSEQIQSGECLSTSTSQPLFAHSKLQWNVQKNININRIRMQYFFRIKRFLGYTSHYIKPAVLFCCLVNRKCLWRHENRSK